MKRIVCSVLAICLCFCLCLTGCGDDGTGKGFRFPLSAEPRQLDPQVATDTASLTVISSLFEGLTRLDETGHPVPAAATWTVSEDGRTYTFTLKESYWTTQSSREEDYMWEEAMPVTAPDFLFGFQRALSPSTGSPSASALYSIKNAKAIHTGKKKMSTLGVQVTAEDTLVITLEKPDDHFLAALSTAPCMPCHQAFFDHTAGRYGLEKEYVLSNGPFALSAWNHQESLLLHKHEGYHGADAVAPEAVRFVLEEPEDVLKALEEGTLDAAPLSSAELSKAQAAGVQTICLEDSIRSLYFNTSRAPLKNLYVRRALRDSVAWDTVYDYLRASGENPATGYVAPAATVPEGGSYRTGDNALGFVTKTSQAATNLGKGLTALYPEDAVPVLPTLTLLAAEDAVSANVARYLVQSWQKNLRISVELELVSESVLAARMASGNYEMAIYTTTATGLTAGENLSVYRTAAENLSRFYNKKVAAACNQALAGGRKEAQALETLLYQQCPSLPLSFPTRCFGLSADSEGILVRPFGGGAYGGPYGFLEAKKWD